MADPIPLADNSMSGNFINPAYATPAQVKQLRDYADALQKGSIADTSKSWTGVLAQALMGINGAVQANHAADLEKRGIQSAATQDTTARQLQGASALPSNDIYGAITQQESGGNPNIAPSVNGAIGPGQIMPATFQQYAKPGERIDNPADNSAVSQRIVQDYSQKYGGDPARIATAYFSGPGNVAPPGSPVPWKNDAADGNGKRVSSYVSDIAARLTGRPPQRMAQNGITPYSAYQHNPWANPQEQALARGIVTPEVKPNEAGQPAATSLAGGATALPTQGGYQSGFKAPFAVTTPNASVSGTSIQAPNQSGGIAGPANAAMDVAATMAGRGAAIGETSKQTGQDIASANAAIPQIQVLKTMRDSIQNSPTMQYGPTAPWLTNLQMAIAQHAPGLLSDEQIHGLAAANGVDKLTAQLGNILSTNGSGTDAKLFNNLQAVPGRAHNSKEGMLDLIDMLIQQQGINHQFISQNMNKISQGMSPADFTNLRNSYFDQHPIINPATKNPITLDLTKSQPGQQQGGASTGGGWGIVR